MKIIDLSIATENDIPSDPATAIPKITYIEHKDSGKYLAADYHCTLEDLGGVGCGTELISLSSHSGTHLDAPWHFYPTMNNGEPAMRIDEMPLEWCIGDGVILDFRDKGDGYKLGVKDFEEKLKELNYELKPLDIVLIISGAADKWGKKEFFDSGCGVSKEATLWLADKGIHIMGTDAWSWDVPFCYTTKEFEKTGDTSLLWEAHKAGAKCVVGHMEKLTNLDKVPPIGAKIICLPIKIKAASAGWVRAVAVVED